MIASDIRTIHNYGEAYDYLEKWFFDRITTGYEDSFKIDGVRIEYEVSDIEYLNDCHFEHNNTVSEEYIKFYVSETWKYGGYDTIVHKFKMNELLSIIRTEKINHLMSKLNSKKEVSNVV